MSRGKKGRKIKIYTKPTKQIANRDKEKRCIQIITDLMMEGYSASYIKSYMVEAKELNLKPYTVGHLYTEATGILGSEYCKKTLTVKSIHVARYNETINDLIKTEELDKDEIDNEEGGISWEEWMKSRNRKIEKFDECLETMFSKERCLMMHSASFVIQINHDITINSHKKRNIDITKLSFEEKLDLLAIISKTKKGEFELLSVTDPVIEEVKTIEAEAVVVATAINIDSIKQDKPPLQKELGRVVSDPTASLKTALQKIAASKLHKDNPNSGIKIIDQEKIN